MNMKRKVYTETTKNYETISGLQHVVEEGGVQVAGFTNRRDANRFAKLLNQETEPCHCDTPQREEEPT